MGFARTVTGLIALTSGFFYLTSASSLTDSGKWTLIGVTFAFTSIWVLMGSRKIPKSPAEPAVLQDSATEETVEEETEDDSGIPQPVKQNSLDGASLRERKLAKIKAAELEQQSLQSEDGDMEVVEEIEVEIDDLHTADEYVVEVSPESVEDADIEVTVSNRRIKHQEIRNRIEKRRRGQLAEIRASTVRMWEEHTAGEDLVEVLQTENHGQNVLVEPENPQPGHIYGATFIRLDETNILKLRTPLDDGFEEVEKKPKLPELIGLDGKALPPLPGMESLPLPPLPSLPGLNPSASSALAALKEEMED